MRYFYSLVKVCALVLLFVAGAWAQETTGGLQGTVKDSTGAVVPGAHVAVTSASLVGSKEIDTDGSGYYRFANLPPGSYTVTVSAKGFKSIKQQGLLIEVGHLPSLDFTLEVGATATTVEVTAAPPLIDTTTSRSMTNVTDDVINVVPHGLSFQSVLQFAPSARNEPLQGGMGSGFGGTGGCSPTGCSNGGAAGYQVGGAADSENGYLVEGQDTANLIGGYSHTNVPFDFIDEVQVKTSGIEAEHGGALGGVANVIMKKGANNWHGAVNLQYSWSGVNGMPNDFSRYDPSVVNTPTTWGAIDPTYQQYSPKKDTTKDFLPGATVAGPILKDRIWFFAGFEPELNKVRRSLDFSNQGLGVLNFDQNTQTYYTNGRIDAEISKKVRVYGSWLYQYQRLSGENMPTADSTQGFYNVSAHTPPYVFQHGLGYGAPNNTTNVGADFTLTPRLVATTRFGYYFENYRDFGFPSTGTTFIWQNSGVGGMQACTPVPPATTCTGAALPANLQRPTLYASAPNNVNNTLKNANKRIQFNQDLAWFKSGWAGTHNFKFGYQLNQLSNDIYQRWNTPEVDIYAGTSTPYSPASPTGAANCAPFVALHGGCVGQFGIATLRDFGSYGYAESRNHGFFFQDAWTIGHGVTINAGLRIEKEYLPAEDQPKGGISTPINFSWGDKIAPRLGVAWDVLHNGKLKLFGGYGVFNDTMKLNLAISSFGGQYWQNCAYALNTSNLSTIVPAFDSTGRFCSGPAASSEGNFAGTGTTPPPGLTFLENQNFRTFPTTCGTCTATEEGVMPNLKPYRQHESTLGADIQLTKGLALEARWDRRRLDHAIEDSAIFDPATGSETFVIVNPGQGVNKTFEGFYQFLYGVPSQPGGCTPTSTPACQNNIPAQRNYDGVEIRLTKAYSSHWTGMFSYTYSRLWGNYEGLTSTNIGDAGGGRNSPNNSRAFDEPYFSWSSFGTSSSGLMPTDRPNTFKAWTYYDLNEGKAFKTDFGLFAYLYQGTAQTSMADVGYEVPGFPFAPVLLAGSGKWLDVAQNPATGAVTVGSPRVYRTPWYNQADLSVGQSYKFKESRALRFSVNFTNLFNSRATTAYWPYLNSLYAFNALAPGGLYFFQGSAFYSAAEHPYNVQNLLNSSGFLNANAPGPISVNSQYGKPYLFQLSRNIRFGLKFTF